MFLKYEKMWLFSCMPPLVCVWLQQTCTIFNFSLLIDESYLALMLCVCACVRTCVCVCVFSWFPLKGFEVFSTGSFALFTLLKHSFLQPHPHQTHTHIHTHPPPFPPPSSFPFRNTSKVAGWGWEDLLFYRCEVIGALCVHACAFLHANCTCTQYTMKTFRFWNCDQHKWFMYKKKTNKKASWIVPFWYNIWRNRKKNATFCKTVVNEKFTLHFIQENITSTNVDCVHTSLHT